VDERGYQGDKLAGTVSTISRSDDDGPFILDETSLENLHMKATQSIDAWIPG